MKVLVACEFSGTVRDAFTAAGHNAMSCDILPTASPGPHYQGDVMDVLDDGWDMLLAFPPCTHLCVSGARWFKEKRADGRQQRGRDFFMKMVNAPVARIAIENPIGIMSTHYRKPDQIIHPWQYGHEECKSTCLWLTGLPLLISTDIVGPPPELGNDDRKRWEKIWRMPPRGWNGEGDRRGRSITYSGIAAAFADQWGAL